MLPLRDLGIKYAPFPIPIRDFPLPIRDLPIAVRDFPIPAGDLPIPVRDLPFPLRDFPIPVTDFPPPVRDLPIQHRDDPPDPLLRAVGYYQLLFLLRGGVVRLDLENQVVLLPLDGHPVPVLDRPLEKLLGQGIL